MTTLDLTLKQTPDKESVLEALNNASLLTVSLSPDKSRLDLMDAHDYRFTYELTKQEVLQLVEELMLLADEMKD